MIFVMMELSLESSLRLLTELVFRHKRIAFYNNPAPVPASLPDFALEASLGNNASCSALRLASLLRVWRYLPVLGILVRD